MNRTHYEMPIEFSRAFIAYTEMIRPSIVFDDHCVLRYTDEIYWRAKHIIVEYNNINWLALYLFLIIGAGLVLVGGSTLTIVYFCRNRYKEVNLEDVKNITEVEEVKNDTKDPIGPSAVRESELNY